MASLVAQLVATALTPPVEWGQARNGGLIGTDASGVVYVIRGTDKRDRHPFILGTLKDGRVRLVSWARSENHARHRAQQHSRRSI